MDRASKSNWKRRLWLSLVYAGLSVIVSTAFVIFLSSFSTGIKPNHLLNLSEDVVGFPLITGWFVISLAFGEWRTVHQGQIALVPLVSIGIDAALTFAAWEFFHRKANRGLASQGMLHLDR